jgi:quercetin dioxygenase-like cupin family protein
MEILKISSLTEFSPVKYVKVPLKNTKGLVRLLCFEPGQSVALHKHPEGDEIFYVLSGAAEFTIGEETARIEAGSFVKAPAETFHSWKNGPEKLILISVLIPPSSYELAERATKMEFF